MTHDNGSELDHHVIRGQNLVVPNEYSRFHEYLAHSSFQMSPLTSIPTLWNKYFSGKLRISSQPPQKSSGDSVLALSLSSVLLLILSSVFYPLPLFFLIIFFRFLYRTLTKYLEASIFSQLCCCWFQTSMIHIIYSFKWWSWLKINSEFRGLKAKKKGSLRCQNSMHSTCVK